MARTSRRVVVSPVKKPFPWGFVAGAAVLVLLLGGILGFAIANQGSGFRTATDRVDETFEGLRVADAPTANHVEGRVQYASVESTPPNSGNHSSYPQTCAVYEAPVVPEHAVHSLEHGAVWVTYRPDLPADQVEVLRGLVEGNPYRLLSPYEGLGSAVSLQAWGRSLAVDSATDPRVERFLEEYSDGPQAREKGAPCSGGPAVPGDEPLVPGPQGDFVPASAAGAPPVVDPAAPPADPAAPPAVDPAAPPAVVPVQPSAAPSS